MADENNTTEHILYIKTGGGLSRIVSQVPVTKKRKTIKHIPLESKRGKRGNKKD